MGKKKCLYILLVAFFFSFHLGSTIESAWEAGTPILSWNTFLGGTSVDEASGIAVDSVGFVYVTGASNNNWGWPVRLYSGQYDAFVAKLDSSGNLLWNTFLGSSSSDYGKAIAVDAAGNVYVAGYSETTWGLPIHPYTGSHDAFVAKLSSGGCLVWHTFLGGTSNDEASGIAVNSSGEVHVVGTSYAEWGSPIRLIQGLHDAFVAKLNSSGYLVWNTFLGSTGGDNGNAVAMDTLGNIYIVGESEDVWWEAPSPIRQYSGCWDAFAAKLDSTGVLQWHTFLGSSNDDFGQSIALDVAQNVYLTGYSSDSWESPIRPHSGDKDAFVAKLDGTGLVLWNTFLGSTYYDNGNGVAADAHGSIYVTGTSFATWASPFRPYSGEVDAFVAMLDGNGVLKWNSFLGSEFGEYGRAIAVDAPGDVYVGGEGAGAWGSPVRPHTNDSDAFVAMIFSSRGPSLVFGGHDFDGNGSSDICVYRPSNGVWYISGLSDIQWGARGDIPVQGNYDADTATEIAIFRPESGLWLIFGGATTQWGIPSDMPVPHDYNGDGVTDLAVWRPSNGVWYISGVGDFQWGRDGDYPVPGDYDGDNIDEIAVWRPTTGTWHICGEPTIQWGTQGDIPVPADYDGDGTTDFAVYRPLTGMWYVRYIGGEGTVQWGSIADVSVPGDYDGDGTIEIAVFRPGAGLWYIYGNGKYKWGQAGDIPLVR